MMRSTVPSIVGVLAIAGAEMLRAQAIPRTLPHPIVPPAAFRNALEQGSRSGGGAPGSAYWQQWADYALRARLDPDGKQLDGSGTIVYHNASPDTLPVVFLHLFQNLHAQGAIRNGFEEVTGGVRVDRVVANGRPLAAVAASNAPGWGQFGTIMRLRLPEPLLPGDSLTLELEWAFRVPQSGSGRMGWSRDDLFHIAYWYPQMAVYDDVGGWHLDQYLGTAEFYAGFGSYRLTVDVPHGWVVSATGTLENPDEVLPEEIARRLRAAAASDEVVHVLTADDFGPGRATRRSDSGTLAWHFAADTVRDVAFSVTRRSLWDAARTPVGDRDGDGRGDYARVDVLYRETAPRWREVWRYAQHAIDFLSRWTGFSYPWSHMTAVEGAGIIGGGMEFPMMTLIGDYNTAGDTALYNVTAHELAHMWVPMIVGSDEKRYAWIDEGTTSFHENQARKEFHPGLDHDEPDRQDYIEVARHEAEGEMMRWSDYHYPGPAYVTASYRKPATLLATLRGLLGEEAFTRGLRTFIRSWAFKLPTPWDLFNTFEAAAGSDLDWFWHSWYYETWVLDRAVASVATTTGSAAATHVTTIVIDDRGRVPMPARVRITLADGSAIDREVSVDTWLAGAHRATVQVMTAAPAVRVEIDPDPAFPDVDRSNNVWESRK